MAFPRSCSTTRQQPSNSQFPHAFELPVCFSSYRIVTHVFRRRRRRWSLLHDILGSSVTASSSAPSSADLETTLIHVIMLRLRRVSPQQHETTNHAHPRNHVPSPPRITAALAAAHVDAHAAARAVAAARSSPPSIFGKRRSCPRSSLLTSAPTVVAVLYRQAQYSVFILALMILSLDRILSLAINLKTLR